MSKDNLICPKCGSIKIVRNGRTRHGRQNYKCIHCGRQFVQDPQGRIAENVKQIVTNMISEGFEMAIIERITGVSRSWIYIIKRKEIRNERTN